MLSFIHFLTKSLAQLSRVNHQMRDYCGKYLIQTIYCFQLLNPSCHGCKIRELWSRLLTTESYCKPSVNGDRETWMYHHAIHI